MRRPAERAVTLDSKRPSPIKILNNEPLAQPRHVIVIAELGSNIYPFKAEQLQLKIRAAAAAGADAVKIQLFKAEHFPVAEREVKERFEFPRHMIPVFAQIAIQHELAYGASVFDKQAVDMAVAARCDFLKLATRETGNTRLRAYCHEEFGEPIYRSVNWPIDRTVSEADTAWTMLAVPGEVTLGCVSEYPTNRPAWWNLANLKSDLFDPFGWSSHTQGMEDVLIAVQAGATVIEKHLATDPTDVEAEWSLLPPEFGQMVEAIRKMEADDDAHLRVS
ncbi:hypothetical protein LCGC14_1725690 [marine sediment metagenome]|uniref:PseI/NeuA/B-like domain-containing protein n=1 Tax=marine sediment metagenome TaxID=412755 RepID=A0A0F9KAV9_9ZZZZ